MLLDLGCEGRKSILNFIIVSCRNDNFIDMNKKANFSTSSKKKQNKHKYDDWVCSFCFNYNYSFRT